jgi:NAD(P)-dependent dehydrogenase (short-subunit alcohol dehydrogenase family)
MSRQDFLGEHVVVVGGASGIGLAVARGALARGARATVLDVAEARFPELRRDTPDLRLEALDVRDDTALTAFFRATPEVDHVYVSAGTVKMGDLFAEPVELQLESLVLRVWGSARVARASARRIRPGGSLTFTGGISTDRPVPGAWVSSVGTAAAEQLARALALELAPVRCNAIAPGWTDTPMWDAVLGAKKREVLDAVAAKLPTRAVASAEQVADAVLFLMSCRAITGEVLHVDGGGRLI